MHTADRILISKFSFAVPAQLPFTVNVDTHEIFVLDRLIYDSEKAALFSAENKVYNECSIVSMDPQTGEPEVKRPDRVVISGTTITVIDFKCGKPWSEHIEQVQAYMLLMSRMYPQMEVRGFLWYIYSGEIKKVDLCQ